MIAVFNIFLLIISQIYCRDFKLKQQNSTLHVGVLENQYPTFVDKSNSDTFTDHKIKKKPGWVIISVNDTKNKVFDIEGGRKNLIYWPKHAKGNQQFKIIPVNGNLIVIQSEMGECLTFKEIENKFQIELCNPSKGYLNQLFEMVFEDELDKKKEDESSVSDSKSEETKQEEPKIEEVEPNKNEPEEDKPKMIKQQEKKFPDPIKVSQVNCNPNSPMMQSNPSYCFCINSKCENKPSMTNVHSRS